MPFTMQCISSDYVSLWGHSPASLRGDHFHQDLHPPPLAIVGHVDACLIWKHSVCSICRRTCFLTCLKSQFSDIQNVLEWNQMNRERLLPKCWTKREGMSACETKAVVHWESGSILGTILANANVPMIPQCCYGKLPPASPHLWRTAAVYPQLPTALPTALPG